MGIITAIIIALLSIVTDQNSKQIVTDQNSKIIVTDQNIKP